HDGTHEPESRADPRSREPRVRHGRQVRRASRGARRSDADRRAFRGENTLKGKSSKSDVKRLKSEVKGLKSDVRNLKSRGSLEIAKKASPFSRIEDAVDAIRSGRMVIVVDDEDRENEGDLTIAAEKITPEAINFMARHGRGLICLSLTP